jgi:hypothetical protein
MLRGRRALQSRSWFISCPTLFQECRELERHGHVRDVVTAAALLPMF